MSRRGAKRRRPISESRRCINCSFFIPRGRNAHSVENESDQVINLLQSWITPTQVSSESITCNECWAILQDRANKLNEEDALPAFGHKKVCFSCGCSILRATRTYPVRQDCKERNILLRNVPLHLISRMESVCAACWRAATREQQQQNQHDVNRITLHDPELMEKSNISMPPSLSSPMAQPVFQKVPVISKITSFVYRRAAGTSKRCIFVNCFKRERLQIPSSVKELLLLNYKFYVPPAARICHYHLKHGRWSELTSQLRDFTGQQFDIIMNMMQKALNHYRDFSNISMMPRHLCNYWFGMDSDQFHDLLNCIPDLEKHVPNASVALSIYLVKLRTGDSNERLATLFNKPRSTLERLMNKARWCLTKKNIIWLNS